MRIIRSDSVINVRLLFSVLTLTEVVKYLLTSPITVKNKKHEELAS